MKDAADRQRTTWYRDAVATLRRPQHLVADVALPGVLMVLDLLAFWNTDVTSWPQGAIVAYACLGYAALAFRRRAPLAVFVTVWLHAVVALAAVPGYVPTLALPVALYNASARCRSVPARAMLGAALVVAMVNANRERADNPAVGANAFIVAVVVFALVYTGAFVLGQLTRRSLLQVQASERRRAVAAKEAVAAERVRLARELHDIIASSVSIMTLQAAGARALLATDPDRADEALATITTVGKQSMNELGRLLGVLRADGVVGPATEPQLQPGLAGLDDLVEQIRSAGIDVRLDRIGGGALDASVDFATYRMVQESLTNTAKHAGPGARASVVIDWTAGTRLVVLVKDDGPVNGTVSQGLSTGHGLLGLQERVRAVGGQLRAGPLEPRGFQVRAELPVAQPNAPLPASGGGRR